MNEKFDYFVSLIGYNIPESFNYANYINLIYNEDIDYVINDIAAYHYETISTLNVPEELHRLMHARSISFKNEEDYLAFKLNFDV